MAVSDYLAAQGFDVKVAWARTRGSMLTHVTEWHPPCHRSESRDSTPGAQQVNYFLGMLGELLQRMDDEALPMGLPCLSIASTGVRSTDSLVWLATGSDFTSSGLSEAPRACSA